MSYKVQNIIVGAAKLYLSVKDSTDPTFIVGGAFGPALPTATVGQSITVALDADTTNWRHAGYTTSGVEVSYEPTYGEIPVDQSLDAAKLFKQSMTASVKTEFAEATLENLLVVWGQQASTLSSGVLGISSGALGDEPVERSLAFVGPAPRGASNAIQERIYHVHRALSVESTSHGIKRDSGTMFPVGFRLLADPSRSGKEYGSVTDRVKTA